LIEPRPWHFFSGGSGDKKIRNKNKRSRGEGRKNAKVRFLSLSFGGEGGLFNLFFFSFSCTKQFCRSNDSIKSVDGFMALCLLPADELHFAYPYKIREWR